MDYFPMFVAMRGRPCLVVGGGQVAARKVALLLRAGAHVQVVTPELCDELQLSVAAQRIVHRAGAYQPSDLEGIDLVIAATDDAAVNAAVSKDARARRLPVNVVDQPALCTFIVPSIVDRSPLVVAISTGGAAPVLARHLRTKIEAMLPARLGEIAKLSARVRAEVKAHLPSVARRRAFWESVFEGPMMHALLDGDADASEKTLRARLHADEVGAGTLHLIGTGTGDPDLLTLRALHALQAASCVAYCGDVPEAVLDLARRDAHRESLPADLVFAAETAMEHLAARVRTGEQVCVLAEGDPFTGPVESPFSTTARALGVPWGAIAPGRTS